HKPSELQGHRTQYLSKERSPSCASLRQKNGPRIYCTLKSKKDLLRTPPLLNRSTKKRNLLLKCLFLHLSAGRRLRSIRRKVDKPR
ncbi:unnamed protein product, partial [Prorocentrum cordatum]